MKNYNWKVSLFEPSGYLTVLCAHIIASGDFRRKSAKKGPLLFETLATNTDLNMQNRPALGRRLGIIDIYLVLVSTLISSYRWRY